MEKVAPSQATSGPEAVTLLDAILFLADHGAIKSVDSLGKPMSGELRKLTAEAHKDRATAAFGARDTCKRSNFL